MTENTTIADAMEEDPGTLPEEAADDPEPPVEDHVQRTISESADKIRLKTKLTRGTGTRDQEKHKIKARGETPAEAADNLSETLRELEERDVFGRARELGNEEADDE